MKFQVYNNSKQNEWDNFINDSRNGTFLFLRGYMDYHQERFDDHSLLISNEKDQLIALLPANLSRDHLISHGGLTYGGFIISDQMNTTLMIDLFKETILYLKSKSIKKFIYKTIPAIYHKSPSEEDLYALFLEKAKLIRRDVLSVVNLKNQIKYQKIRIRGLKKAKKNALNVQRVYNLKSFWNILESVLLKIHNVSPTHSLKEMENLSKNFPNNIKLFGCFRNDILIAGVMIYESDRVAHAQYIASNSEGRTYGALDMIFDYLIKTHYKNTSYLDFGISNELEGLVLNKGLINHKEGYGARAVVHDHYILDLK